MLMEIKQEYSLIEPRMEVHASGDISVCMAAHECTVVIYLGDPLYTKTRSGLTASL